MKRTAGSGHLSAAAPARALTEGELVERIRAAGPMPLRRLAALIGVSHETVRQVGLRYGLIETAAPRRERIRALRAEGRSYAAVATLTGLSIRRVRELSQR